MVDFNKALEDHRREGKFLGYCNYCDLASKIYEINLIPPYEINDLDARCKCPRCNKFQSVADLIPF